MAERTVPKLVLDDPWLEPQAEVIQHRIQRYEDALREIQRESGTLRDYASIHQHLGLHRYGEQWRIREWLPGARKVSLIGDFNGWSETLHPLSKNEDGVWESTFSDDLLGHGALYKIWVEGADGSHRHRLPATAYRATQDAETHDFCAQLWTPPSPYEWRHTAPKVSHPYVYEAHVGIAGVEERVHTYKEFTTHILPRISALGYNTIQLMAVQEHPYYGSFGYHVSSLFGVSSRFGTPEELKELIDTAHGMGMAVLLDIVHSHAIKNLAEGLSEMDGTPDQYFHAGEAGEHPQWDSKIFNYGKPEVRRFLLSNVRYWLEEFHFDGFRFDGVTSMLYHHRGTEGFGDYWSYFGESSDKEAVLYLQLATALTREIRPDALLVAEDMSGMPGLCRPISEGGIGFTHRLAMGIPDHWITLLKEQRDEEWNLQQLWDTLSSRRAGEETIAYAESHDQALVGDKTLAFWLMDKEMYTHMSVAAQSHVIDRGMALHKMIRLLTLSAGGTGYLTFIGNEFGHPEWLDFPREGNGWSYQYARRQWNLPDDPTLRYKFLQSFDEAMVKKMQAETLFQAGTAHLYEIHEERKILTFERHHLIFLFNFHASDSYQSLEIPVLQSGSYRIILSTDHEDFGGMHRVDPAVFIPTYEDSAGYHKAKVYLPSRTAIVLAPA